MIYGFKLEELREENNYKQKELASIIGVDRSVYGQYEREDKIIPLKHLNTLCNYYGISFDFVFGFSDDKKNIQLKSIDKKIAGKRLKELRKKENLSQEDFSSQFGTTYGTISGYERGRYLISTRLLYDICDHYKISADYLLGKND